MFVPLFDDNPLRTIRAPYVTHALIAANCIIFFLFQSELVFRADQAASLMFGMVPAVAHAKAVLPPGYALIPEPLTFFTYMFLHGGWMHLLGNMLFLWVFGDNVEDGMGHVRFLAFYLLCGAFAGFTHFLAAPTSEAPLVGASGAIAGVVGAYLVLFPRIRLWALVLMRIPVKIRAYWVIGGWIVFQLFNALTVKDDDVAWWAHIGGVAAGLALVLLMRRRGRALAPEPLA